jgi:hypothetical protein
MLEIRTNDRGDEVIPGLLFELDISTAYNSYL